MTEEPTQSGPNLNADPQPELPQNWLANFLPMFVGQVLSLLGSSLVQFALVWYVTKQTGDAAVLATGTTAALIPNILFGPFVGALIDRWNRKRVMMIADSVVALATAVLALLFAFGLIQIWHIYAVLFTRSMAEIFQRPAKSASVSLMVPKDQLTRLGGINQAAQGVIDTFSPALGAVLIEILPIQGILAIDFVTAAIAVLLLLFFVQVPQPKSVSQAMVTPKSLLRDVKQGFQYIFGWHGLLILIIMASLMNMFFAPVGSLLPLLVTEFFARAAQDLAWLQVAMGAGAIAGGILLGVWGGFRRKMINILIGIAGFSLGVLVLGIVPQNGYWLAVAAFGGVGLMGAITNGSLGPLLQIKVPPEVQGRVFTVLSSMCLGMMPIGLFLSAPIAKKFGIQAAYLAAGIAGLLMTLFALLDKRVMTLEDQRPGGTEEK